MAPLLCDAFRTSAARANSKLLNECWKDDLADSTFRVRGPLSVNVLCDQT